MFAACSREAPKILDPQIETAPETARELKLHDVAPQVLDVVDADPPKPPEHCEDALEINHFLVTTAGAKLNILARSPEPIADPMLIAWGPARQEVLSFKPLGGPPFGYFGTLSVDTEGPWTLGLVSGDNVLGCKRLDISLQNGLIQDTFYPLGPPTDWTPADEDFYALFVELLFSGAKDFDTSWGDLSVLLRDGALNMLASDEDAGLTIKPIAADLPIVLRGYFAKKRNLPLMVRRCEDNKKCRDVVLRAEESQALNNWLEEVGAQVKVGHWLDEGDVYEVGLDRPSLAPGAIFADWHGHTFVVVRWTNKGLWVAEAKLSGRIVVYETWRGRLLWTRGMRGGFRRFRPIQNGVYLDNAHLTNPWMPWSNSAQALERADWYAALEALIEARPVDWRAVQLQKFDRVKRMLSERIGAVQEGDAYAKGRPVKAGNRVEMPSGASIFSTTGPWEDYSTPARDLRLLVGFDEFLGFPGVLKEMPARFGLQTSTQVDEAVAAALAAQDVLLSEQLTYVRSDGSPWTLSFAQLVARLEALEAAYHPDDCPEVRWGAPPGSEEISPCRRRASAQQQQKMERYRSWFRDRTRPPLSYLEFD